MYQHIKGSEMCGNQQTGVSVPGVSQIYLMTQFSCLFFGEGRELKGEYLPVCTLKSQKRQSLYSDPSNTCLGRDLFSR